MPANLYFAMNVTVKVRNAVRNALREIMDNSDCEKFAESLQADIEAYFESTLDLDHRSHLGASRIGEPCSRRLWYEFRNASPNKLTSGQKRTPGQIARVFERGHREEPYIIKWLTAIGCQLFFTPEEQVRISSCNGHFGGSLDNIGKLPEKYQIEENVLFEFKTINTQDFLKLKREGVKIAQPKHWAQICTYGVEKKLRFCLYVSIDKNTEEIYLEFCILDWEYGNMMIAKAEAIINSPIPLNKISMSPSHFSCKWCQFIDVCQYGEAMQKSCKTCIHSMPTEAGQWGCGLYGCVIPEHVVPKGCDKFTVIKG